MSRRPVLTLLLLPWLLLGHGGPRRLGAEAEGRVVSATSISDTPANAALRVDDSRDLVRTISQAGRGTKLTPRHPSPDALPLVVETSRSVVAPAATALRDAGARVARPRRLTIPHNANAPPVRQS